MPKYTRKTLLSSMYNEKFSRNSRVYETMKCFVETRIGGIKIKNIFDLNILCENCTSRSFVRVRLRKCKVIFYLQTQIL